MCYIYREWNIVTLILNVNNVILTTHLVLTLTINLALTLTTNLALTLTTTTTIH